MTRLTARYFFSMLVMLMTPVTALASGELVTLDTRPDITQTLLLFEPSEPIRAVIMVFPGHNGKITFRKQLFSKGYVAERRGDGLTQSQTTRNTYLDNGFVVALLAPPSDQKRGMNPQFRSSEMHYSDISKVIEFLRQRYRQDVYLHGHCKSSFSAASVATKRRNEGIAGLVLSSPRSKTRRIKGGVTDFEKGVITVPVLLVQHLDDPCKGTLYKNLEQVSNFYEASSKQVDVILVSGGETGSTGPTSCNNKQHSFMGLQRETAQAIAEWVKGNEFPRHIHD